ncbi:MAG: prolyl aminopeptidase, partial [Bradyrhizobium sp.]|nr:prolyl aminopeptidase [Bradyrhizobium sp.]
GTRAEVEAAFGPALARFYPDLHRDFLEILPDDARSAAVASYWQRILDPDPAVHGPAARAWHDTERALSEVKPGRTRLDRLAIRSGNAIPATPFMEAHYFQNDCFMAPDQLLRDAGKLAGIPGIIVQGRYDLLCPPATSQALAARWPRAEIRILEGAGHTLYDPGVRDAVMKAIADIASRITM